jgi:8-oxo-dGTP pyrophosphatase MutT (NUDIX family)
VTSLSVLELLKQRIRPASSAPVSENRGQPEAAVAIIIDPKNQGGSLLLIRRRERQDDPWSGQVAFPGGHKSLQDRDFLETAVREVSEEVGIDLAEHEMLGVLPHAYSRTRRILVTPFVFQLKSDVTIRLNQEVAESFWVPLGDLSRIASTKSEVFAQKNRLLVDSYVYDGHVIWGLTFRIINTLLDRPQVDMI